ncbi:MAG TPA: threonine/serine dehydratase [Candidatus Limnocylindrales bacterium]
MPPSSAPSLVTVEDVRHAAQRIRGVALRTPLLRFRDLGFVKPENLQPSGSFKIRGAYNTLSQLSDEEKGRGVVAHSSGNHAQAVSLAARLLGIRAVVVMPDNAPQVKVDGVRRYGGEIVFVGPANEERVQRAHEIAATEGLELISSADDRRVVAGQGTVGLEIVEQLDEMSDPGATDLLVVLVPVGLGGLAAGVALTVKSLRPDAQVWGVEPELAADTHDSLAAGERTPWPADKVGRTIADGLRGEAPAPIPFAHLKRYLDGVVLVREIEIEQAMAVAAHELKLVLEPSGAVSLAGMVGHASELPQGRFVAVLTGGNVDPARYIEFLSRNL